MKHQPIVIRTLTGVILAATILFCYSYRWLFSALNITILFIILVFEWPRFVKEKSLFWLTPVYPIAPFIITIWLNYSIYRPIIILSMLSSTITDTAAYLIGSQWGKNLIAPTVSPHKSWQGVIAGISTTIFFWCILIIYVKPDQNYYYSIWYLISYGTISSTACVIGDLFESWLKRRAHIKDSGILLPGHGGFLDRCDGLLFVITILYFFRQHITTLFYFF